MRDVVGGGHRRGEQATVDSVYPRCAAAAAAAAAAGGEDLHREDCRLGGRGVFTLSVLLKGNSTACRDMGVHE